VAALGEVLQIPLRMKGEAVSRVLSVRDLPVQEGLEQNQNQNPGEKQREFVELQTRVDPLWQPVVLAYQGAFEYWRNKDYKNYAMALQRAEALEKNTGTYLEKIDDYLNWVIVNYPTDRGRAEFEGCRSSLAALEAERTRFRKVKKLPERTFLDENAF